MKPHYKFCCTKLIVANLLINSKSKILNSVINTLRLQIRNNFAYLVYLYAFLIPFPKNLKSISLILITFLWLISLNSFKTTFKLILKDKLVLSFLALYVIFIVAFFYSDNKQEALDYVALQISIPLLLFVFYGKLTSSQIKRACFAFTLSIFTISIFAIYKTYTDHFHSFELTVANFKNLDWEYFSFCLPKSASFHAPYFSLYMSIGSIILINELLSDLVTPPRKVLVILILIYFLAFIALLSSRTAFFATIIVFAFIIFKQLLKKQKPFMITFFMVSLFVVSITAFINVPYLYNKTIAAAGVSERAILWKSALNVLKDNPVYGVGTGDRTAALVNEYEKINFEAGIRSSLNAHNQFLDTSVSLGLLGLFTLMLCLYGIIKSAVIEDNTLLLSFIIIFMICCLTESLLNRQAGVFIFSFFCALLTVAKKPSPDLK